ncbi:MAG: rhodanese-like domain-containing protein [Chloroflexota bacterium]|nr:rhodanese-like domain-containing protein [Chloroflexota bacterium]
MAKTFRQMVAEGREGTPMVSPQEAQQRMQSDPSTLVVDVRDAQDLGGTGIIPGAVNVSLGTLPLRADQELPEDFRNPELQDRDRPIITTCGGGGQASLAAKVLKDMGFKNVSILEGGTNGWKQAGLPTVQPGEKS